MQRLLLYLNIIKNQKITRFVIQITKNFSTPQSNMIQNFTLQLWPSPNSSRLTLLKTRSLEILFLRIQLEEEVADYHLLLTNAQRNKCAERLRVSVLNREWHLLSKGIQAKRCMLHLLFFIKILQTNTRCIQLSHKRLRYRIRFHS